MKKKLCKVFVFIILLLGFTNVYAEEVSVKQLPKDYKTKETGGYEYTIEGFDLKVYNVDVENDDAAMENYVAGRADKTIPLIVDDLTFNHEVKETTIQNVPATIVGLNLNLTKEKLENYLSEEMANATPEKAFLVELVVKYKLTKPKVDTPFKYNINVVKDFLGSLMDNNHQLQAVTLNTTITQTLNIIVVEYDNESRQRIIEYENHVTEENGIGSYIVNYLILSNEEIEINDKKATDMLMFHSIDNIDYILESINESDDDPDEDDIKDVIPGSSKQEVNVPDTAKTIPKYFYIISTLMILGGASIITYTISKSN